MLVEEEKKRACFELHRLCYLMEISLKHLMHSLHTNLTGNGNLGSIYQGILKNGMVFAVKVLNLTRYDALKSFMAECEGLLDIEMALICSSIDYNSN